MTLRFRSILFLSILVAGLAGHALLKQHLEAAGSLPQVPLAQSLSAFPLELENWQGQDRTIEDERFLYADEHLQRVYFNQETGQALTVWMAYSEEGADRGHHPEVCMAVAGKPEDPQGRRQLSAAGHDAPIQCFRFGRPGDFQQVYYWHYTLFPPEKGELTDLQRTFQRMRKRPSSLTIEIFAPERVPADNKPVEHFVQLLDASVQELVGSGAIRGNRRIPVTVVDGT